MMRCMCDLSPHGTGASALYRRAPEVWTWDDNGGSTSSNQKRDDMRYWDDAGGSWMYWDSFWAPAEEARFATSSPAFGDAAGRMLSPALAPEVAYYQGLPGGSPRAEGCGSLILRSGYPAPRVAFRAAVSRFCWLLREFGITDMNHEANTNPSTSY